MSIADPSKAQGEFTVNLPTAWDFYTTVAMRSANIPGWEKEPHQAELKDFRHLAREKMPPMDQNYKIMKG